LLLPPVGGHGGLVKHASVLAGVRTLYVGTVISSACFGMIGVAMAADRGRPGRPRPSARPGRVIFMIMGPAVHQGFLATPP
jgi:hypothetical protein